MRETSDRDDKVSGSPAPPFRTNARIISVDRYEKRAFAPSSEAPLGFRGQSEFNPLRTRSLVSYYILSLWKQRQHRKKAKRRMIFVIRKTFQYLYTFIAFNCFGTVHISVIQVNHIQIIKCWQVFWRKSFQSCTLFTLYIVCVCHKYESIRL